MRLHAHCAANAAAPGITVTEVSALELMHTCLADGVAAAREGRPSAIGRPRGSINPESFTKVWVAVLWMHCFARFASSSCGCVLQCVGHLTGGFHNT